MPDYPVQSGTQDTSPEVVAGDSSFAQMSDGSDIAAPGWHPIMYPDAGAYGTSMAPDTDAEPIPQISDDSPVIYPDQES